MTKISVILVSGGVQFNQGRNAGYSVELVHTNGTRLCSLPNLPDYRYFHTQTGLTLCGSEKCEQCSIPSSPTIGTTCLTFFLRGGSWAWRQSHKLFYPRRFHSAWKSPQGVVLLGGFDTPISTLRLRGTLSVDLFNLDHSTM